MSKGGCWGKPWDGEEGGKPRASSQKRQDQAIAGGVSPTQSQA